ncbi:hypothetical protein [Sphingomonas sp.]|uniref:hypothetical protein n=1 Tax=Sphingomonas sp. TaxID=28214 RepID=UPI003BAADBB7
MRGSVLDFCTNRCFTLRERPLKRRNVDDFVQAYGTKHQRHERVESERFRHALQSATS